MDKESNAYCSTASISDSPAKSSSVCSSPLPFSALSPISTCCGAPRKFSMEEVWRDISLSSLHHSSNRSTSASATTTCLALQGSSILDFLSRSPPNRKQRTRAGHEGQYYPIAEGGSASDAPRVVAPMLSLSTSTEIHCVERSHDRSSVKSQQLRTAHNASGKAPCSFYLSRLNPPNYSSTVEFPILGKKRIPVSDGNDSDDRNKRMMKNRESASRSRARKQAYTTGLELEVSRLIEENGRLRRQLEKLCTAAAAAPAQCPKRHMLHRTLTAPF